jgi:hypothetical protein
MTQNSDKLKAYLINNIGRLRSIGGGGAHPQLPIFDLCARDYLYYAEDDLNQYLADKHNRYLINCVLHLKRAIECQMDTFLYVYNLADLFKKRNLGFDKKIDFIKAVGAYSTKTLGRFNTIRNKVEHEYAIPEIVDIELYYDLASAFMAIIENIILLLLYNEMEFTTDRDEEGNESYGEVFYIAYDVEGPTIKAGWEKQGIRNDLIATPNDIIEFAFFFRAFILLSQREAIASNQYFIAKLNEQIAG